LFDADTDGDLDLYLVRGGFEWADKSPNYIDALFLNNGKGYFEPSADALPSSSSSGSCVRAADFDGDGDLDLFIAGRVVPVAYPLAPESFILKNENGKFTNVTDQFCPAIKTVGMVTDAVWTDFDNDGKVDLVIAGELMALKFVKNNGSSMEILSTDADKFKGWWNSIVPFDFDSDGDIDFIAGNLGNNNPYHASDTTPVQVIAKDLDNNGSIEAITACYSRMLDGSVKLCPVHFWDELNQQSPKFRRQFRSYKAFSKSTMATLLSEKDREGAVVLEANYSQSSYIENLGNGRFTVSPLPVEAQVGPVNGILIDDINNDGNADALLIGNDYGNEVFAGRYDAFTGLVLLGNGNGGFTAVGSSASGFYVPHDAKAIVHLPVGDHDLIVASQNRDRLLSFVKSGRASAQIFEPEALDASLVFRFPDGKEQKVTLSYGAGFLSQSSRVVRIPKGVIEVEITRYDGRTRKLALSTL
jgi:enediyne biosynthesis protein E4